jgi:serralysin
MKSRLSEPPGYPPRQPLLATHTGHGSRLALLLCMLPVFSATAAVGDWDPQFGSNGLVEVIGNGGPQVLELADGQVLVVGTAETTNGTAIGTRAIALNRYLPSGEPDASFGNDGHVTVVLPIPVAGISAIALQHDGKVVIAGNSWTNAGAYGFIARVDTAGSLDPAFGSGGVAAFAGTEPF